MRTLSTMTFAFLFASTATTASAQELMALRAPTPPGSRVEEVEEEPVEHGPYVTIEIQARTGGGAIWATSNGHSLPSIEGGFAGAMNLGATLSIRHFESGLGLTGGYTHAFTGLDSHYSTHTFDVRLSERATFARSGDLSVSVLFEIGASFMTGGAHSGCAGPFYDVGDGPTLPVSCTEHDVSVGGIGGVAALGLQFRRGVFLGGVEADYRRLVGSGALAQQDDVMVMARVGIAFDL